MAVTVPERRVILGESEVVIAESVRATSWLTASQQHAWIAGRPVVVVPTFRPGAGDNLGSGHLFVFRTQPRYQDLRYIVRLAVSSTAADAIGVQVTVDGTTYTNVVARPRTTAPTEYEFPVDLPSRWDGEIDIRVGVYETADAGTFRVEGLGVVSVPRTFLDDDNDDLGIDRLAFYPRDPISTSNLGKLLARQNELRADARRVGQYHRAFGELDTPAFTSGTYTALATDDFALQGRALYDGETTRTLFWRVRVRCSDGTTSANVRISDGSGALATIAVPTGSTVARWWPTTGGPPSSFAVDVEDLAEADGLLSSAWDDHTIEIQRTAGAGTIYVLVVSIWEGVDAWMPYDMSPTVWLRGDEEETLDFTSFSWRNDGSTNDFTEATNKPIAGTVAGRASVEFDGTDDTAATTSLLSATVTASAWWCSGVIRADALTVAFSAGSPWTGHGIVSDGGGFWGVYACTTGLYAYQYDGAAKYTAAQAITPGEAVYFEASFDGATLSLSINGAAAVTASAGNITDLTNVVALGFRSGQAAAFDHDLGELVVLGASAPSAANLTGWRDYAAKRWGVSTP